jgi:hypothetical protein
MRRRSRKVIREEGPGEWYAEKGSWYWYEEKGQESDMRRRTRRVIWGEGIMILVWGEGPGEWYEEKGSWYWYEEKGPGEWYEEKGQERGNEEKGAGEWYEEKGPESDTRRMARRLLWGEWNEKKSQDCDMRRRDHESSTVWGEGPGEVKWVVEPGEWYIRRRVRRIIWEE